MFITLMIMWIIWLIPAVLYIYFKRGDWYLFIVPPMFFTIIGLVISCFSEITGILVIVFVHIFIIDVYRQRIKR